MIQDLDIRFEKGKAISPESLNLMINKINELTGIIRILSKSYCNINVELLGNTNPISFSEAIDAVPENRRVPGISIKFNSSEYGWSEYVWKGDRWDSEKYWTRLTDFNDIDGGEFYG